MKIPFMVGFLLAVVVSIPLAAAAQTNGLPAEGASLGGKVRSGPGINHEQIGSLAESKLVTIQENTGIMMNGYPWFKVTHIDNQTGFSIEGYQWGGIMCDFLGKVPGVFNVCPRNWSDNPEIASQKITEDPIAPEHGNSDEDNEIIDIANITKCLDSETSAGRDGAGCIGQVSEKCLEQGDETTVGMRQCIGYEHKAWDSMLNKDYQSLMASLDTNDKKTALRDAQRLWNQFVQKFCALGYKFNQGTIFLVSGDQCMMEMTARQDLELKRLAGNEQQ